MYNCVMKKICKLRELCELQACVHKGYFIDIIFVKQFCCKSVHLMTEDKFMYMNIQYGHC